MQLREYIQQTSGAGVRIARALGVSQSYVSQMASGERPIPVETCVRLEALTDNRVRRWDCRPSSWHLIWPELIGQPDAPVIPVEAVAPGHGQRATGSADQAEERAA